MYLKVTSPIFGFEAIKSVDFVKIDDYFSRIESENISFTLLNPSLVRLYEIEIPDAHRTLLEIEEGDEIGVYSIVILQNPIENSLVNFAAPIVINHSKKRLVQLALDERSYPEFGLSEPISNYLE